MISSFLEIRPELSRRGLRQRVPAVELCLNHKSCGVSLGMYALFTLGVVLWLVYGILIYSWPIIFANRVTLSLAGAVLIMKVKFG